MDDIDAARVAQQAIDAWNAGESVSAHRFQAVLRAVLTALAAVEQERDLAEDGIGQTATYWREQYDLLATRCAAAEQERDRARQRLEDVLAAVESIVPGERATRLAALEAAARRCRLHNRGLGLLINGHAADEEAKAFWAAYNDLEDAVAALTPAAGTP